MAGHKDITDAKTLAEETSVSLRFALKILHKLVQGSFVKSYKGVNGGYVLNLPTDKITLKNVIELIDGPISIARCLESEERCAIGCDKAACAYHHIFDTISYDLAKRLDAITIADVINKSYSL